MIALGWSEVHAIQIASHRIEAIVATRYSIRVEHHDDFEYEVLTQGSALLAVHVDYEVE